MSAACGCLTCFGAIQPGRLDAGVEDSDLNWLWREREE